MIKIGNLAKICNTSAQTLRYYDAEGVLKADYVDEETGYRFYKPEAVEKYKKIVLYKRLGFSLEEIKVLTALPEEDARKMMLRKKEELRSSIKNIQEQVSAIDEISRNPELAYPPLDDLSALPFTDDPEVIGKWTFCGILSDENDITGIRSRNCQDYLRELTFLPGGDFVWMFFWTKGILYRRTNEYNFAIPNPYRIVYRGSEKYLVLQFMSNACIEYAEDPYFLLYRQTDSAAYTDEQIRKYVDRTDLPFVEDKDLCGEWQAVDYVQEISDYDPGFHSDLDFYVTGYRFLPDGKCIRTVCLEQKVSEITLCYTKGTLLNDMQMTAEAYEIRVIDGREVLFVQHKNGDYIYGGLKPHWYVFIRKE